MIDTGRVDPEEPIDLNTLCNTRLFKLKPWEKQYGINLIDEVGLHDMSCVKKTCLSVFEVSDQKIARGLEVFKSRWCYRIDLKFLDR